MSRLLPELLPEQRLSWGNGLLELGTFMAIIFGTIAGGQLFETFKGAYVWAGVVLIGLALFGTVTSLGIDRVPAADPGKKFQANFLADLRGRLRVICKDRVLSLAVLGNSYFFLPGPVTTAGTLAAVHCHPIEGWLRCVPCRSAACRHIPG